MAEKRTDLALEARELLSEEGRRTLPDGVSEETRDVCGFTVTTVKVTNKNGEKELCKPMGTYVTLELGKLLRREDNAFEDGVTALSSELRQIAGLKKDDSVLVVGLGNASITPDAVGHLTATNTLATRHLREKMPQEFSAFRSVSVLEPGVLGTTGMESVEVIKAVTEAVHPSAVIAVDALASRRISRVCSTVQISDTGIVPGSGVGNARAAVNKETLGVTVIAVGVPTVVDAATLAMDIAEESNAGALNENALREHAGSFIVTPRDIDASVAAISRLIGYGIDLALHDGLSVADVEMFLG